MAFAQCDAGGPAALGTGEVDRPRFLLQIFAGLSDANIRPDERRSGIAQPDFRRLELADAHCNRPDLPEQEFPVLDRRDRGAGVAQRLAKIVEAQDPGHQPVWLGDAFAVDRRQSVSTVVLRVTRKGAKRRTAAARIVRVALPSHWFGIHVGILRRRDERR
jgi:hypothetical protein